MPVLPEVGGNVTVLRVPYRAGIGPAVEVAAYHEEGIRRIRLYMHVYLFWPTVFFQGKGGGDESQHQSIGEKLIEEVGGGIRPPVRAERPQPEGWVIG